MITERSDYNASAASTSSAKPEHAQRSGVERRCGLYFVYSATNGSNYGKRFGLRPMLVVVGEYEHRTVHRDGASP